MALQFDLSAIPNSAVIESAVLSLYCFNDPSPSFATTYTVHRITDFWKDSTATWTNATSSQTWLTAGGDFLADTIQTITFPVSSASQWNTCDITTTVQAMVDNQSANYGIIMFAPQHSGEGALWYSSEYAIDSLRPKVQLTYSTTSVNHGRSHAPQRCIISLNRSTSTFSLDGRATNVPTATTHSGVFLQRYVTPTGRSSFFKKAAIGSHNRRDGRATVDRP